MKTIAYYSGKIDVKKDGCYIGEQKIDCPKESQSLFQRPFMQSATYELGSDNLDILPQNPFFNIRNDIIFMPILLAIVISFLALTIFKIKIFGKSLGEYLKPIWYFVLVAEVTVFWQYLVGVTLEGFSLQLRISQWIWELAVLASAYKLSKIAKFGYANMFFLGILYSLFIHGLKVSIRYFFYGKSLWYVLDRFLYGSLLVMAIAFVLGSVFVYLEKKGIRY